MTTNPTRKPRSRPKPSVAEPKRTAKKVEHPPTEKPVLVVETPEENKYAPKEKLMTPTLGRSPNYVTTVGLGKLEVIHAQPDGNTNVWSNPCGPTWI